MAGGCPVCVCVCEGLSTSSSDLFWWLTFTQPNRPNWKLWVGIRDSTSGGGASEAEVIPESSGRVSLNRRGVSFPHSFSWI